jgi:hypothetical protein
MFDSNADQLKKGQDKAKGSSKELEDQLGRTDRQAKQLGDRFLETAKRAGEMLLTAFAVERVYQGVKAQAEYNAQLGLTAQRLNVNIEDLAAWGEASTRAGGSAEGFAGSLDFLNKNMAAVEAGGQSRLKPFFKAMKIEILDIHKKVRPLFDILGDLADRFSKMGAQEVAGFGERLGLDTGTVMMLQMGRRAVEDLVKRQKELGVTSKEDAETAHKFNMQLEDLEQILHKVYTVIGSSILPGLTAFFHKAEDVVQFLERHKTFVEGFFIGTAAAITLYYLPAITRAAVRTLLAIGPYLLIAAAILAVGAAFGLIYDDIVNFMEGNASVIGELSKKWPWIGELVRTVVTDIAAVFQWAVGVLKAGVNLVVAAFEFLWATVAMVGRLITQGWNLTVNFIDGKIKQLVRAFPALGGAFRAVGEVFKSVGHAIVAVFDWIFDKVKHLSQILGFFTRGIAAGTAIVSGLGAAPAAADTHHAIAAGKAAIVTAQLTPLSAARAGAPGGGDKTYHITTGEIHIDAPNAKDGNEVGKTIAGALDTHLRQALNHFDDGVQS